MKLGKTILKEEKDRDIFIFYDRNGKPCFQIKVLAKNNKGEYKYDLIELSISGTFMKTRDFFRMTTYEAECVACGLLQAVVVRKNQIRNKQNKKIMEKKRIVKKNGNTKRRT